MERLTLWRIYDPAPAEKPGCFAIEGGSDEETYREAHRWNAENWGIYETVNRFEGPRQIKNLRELRFWYVECDGENKPEMLKRLRSGLIPTKIIESKRGYHAYWSAKDALQSTYRDLIEYFLIPYYRGDPNAKDVARILRTPDYFHCKNPKDKFFVRKVWECDSAYTESDLRYFYKPPAKKKEVLEKKVEARKEILAHSGSDLFEKIYNLDCEDGLRRLSGTTAVGGERFDFKRTSRGKLNILVDGKATSCWIDSDKRIGSSDRGGPTVWQWVNWYQRDHARTYQLMKEFFPELWT